MRSLLRPSIAALLLLSLITGVIYPTVVTGLATALFPWQAGGSRLEANGQLVGSALLGQGFTDPKFFWSRPSATGPVPYNGAVSSGSNLGPSNPALQQAITDRAAALRAADTSRTGPVPVDLVTASGSGLDPHITPAAAEFQVSRVARVRGISEDSVRTLVARFTEARQFGVLGEPRVNVLRLNLALEGTPTAP
jgi:K+-transporting ATPase ATPase C chain